MSQCKLPVVYDPPQKNCKECLEEFGYCQRPAPYAGPRCQSHALAKRNTDRRRTHRNRVEVQFNFPPGGYDELYAYQDGSCAICRKAKGKSRNLAVDHDHKCCNYNGSCGECIRGLLCMKCNSLLAHIRDDLETARRIYDYLNAPPYWLMKHDQAVRDALEILGTQSVPPHPTEAEFDDLPRLSSEELDSMAQYDEECRDRRLRGEGDPL